MLDALLSYFNLNSNSEVTEIQKKLRVRGFDPGSIDGVFSLVTEEAVKNFQKVNNLTPTGIVDLETYKRLRSHESSDNNPSAPPPPTNL
jgi:peptidoglycan hydrolase-like protein with peptidoglycan-binding domain